MKRIVSFIFMFLLLATTANAEDLSDLGDVREINFEMKPQGEMTLVQEVPLPATFAVDTWVGLSDTEFTTITPKHEILFDNNINTGFMINSLQTQNITFKEPIHISSFRYAAEHIIDLSWGSSGTTPAFRVSFYDDGNRLLVSKQVVISDKTTYKLITGYVQVDLMNVKKIVVSLDRKAEGYIKSKINELEIFPSESVSYDSIYDIYANADINKIDLTFKNPDSKYVSGNIIKINGSIVHNGAKVASYRFTDLEEDTLYKIEVATVYYDDTEIWTTIDVKTKSSNPEKPNDVAALQVGIINNEIVLTYQKPENADYVMIYKDGQLIADQHKSNQFIDTDYVEGKRYVYKVVAVNAGGSSNGNQVSITVPTKEITNLRSSTTDSEVNLYWNVPVYDGFEMVSIYRRQQPTMLERINPFASETYNHLFQTNGTFFKDMTVSPDTPYEYKLTTVSATGNETEGVLINVRTNRVIIGGSETTPDENGDYVVSWTSPTTGNIKIIVGGQEYRVVDAALLQYRIPAEDMRYTALGAPDIRIVPVDEDGREIGAPTVPGGSGSIGGVEDFGELNAPNLLKIAVALLGIVGGFVLLGLSFRVVPKLIQTIRAALGARNKKDNVLPGTGRRT